MFGLHGRKAPDVFRSPDVWRCVVNTRPTDLRVRACLLIRPLLGGCYHFVNQQFANGGLDQGLTWAPGKVLAGGVIKRENKVVKGNVFNLKECPLF